MKTTLRGRMMRLCCITVIVVCVVMVAVGLIACYDMATTNGRILSEYTVNTCVNSISDECTYINNWLSVAEYTDEGDSIFESVYAYEGEYGSMSGLSKGELGFVSPNDNDNSVIAIMNRDGDTVAGELSDDYFTVYINRMSDNGGLGIVCDSDGKIMLSSNLKTVPTGKTLESFGLDWLTSAIKNGGSGTIDSARSSFTESGKNMITYAPIKGTSLYGIYAEDLGLLYEKFRVLLVTTMVIMVLSIAASIVVTFFVSNKICKPVTETIDRVVKLSEGDLSSPCAANERGDETQVLADSLRKMIGNLSSYITDISNVLSQVSEGNLRAQSGVEYTGDFVSIKDSLDTICVRLRATMTAIDEAGEQVFGDSDAVSEGAQLLSANAASEAASLEEINAMASDIAARVSHNTETTNKATGLLGDIVRIVDDGSSTMTQMSDAMNEIKIASDEIQSVVKAIDDIAFQTNILALNAAVEAARAGEAGKGFAVVADEVRNLASKSGEAAQNTMQLVQRCGEAVDRGSTLTEKTDASFKTINQSVAEFSDLMNNIAISSSEQGEAIRQINQGLESITGIVQSNSQAALESAESSRKLKAQADVLSQKVSAFKL